MTPAYRKALKASIAHWKENAALEAEGKPYDSSTYSCALCHHTANLRDIPLDYLVHCDYCPIYEHTGKHRCEGTPYFPTISPTRATDLLAWLTALEAGENPLVVHNTESADDIDLDLS